MLCLSALLSLLPIAYAALELHPNTSSTYPFAVHLPLNATYSPPPVLLFLHGSGSKGGVEDLGDKTRWDGVGWLLSQYDSGNKTGAQAIVADEYLTILPLLPEASEEWDATLVLAVLNAMKELGQSNETYLYDESRVHLAGYSIGSFGVWKTSLIVNYPTPFASILPWGGSRDFTSQQLVTLATPPQNVSTISIYAAGGSIDEKQPASETLAALAEFDEVAARGLSRNWTAQVIEGADHKRMSQQAWFEMDVWEWLRDQKKQGRNDTEDAGSTISSSKTSDAGRSRRIGWW